MNYSLNQFSHVKHWNPYVKWICSHFPDFIDLQQASIIQLTMYPSLKVSFGISPFRRHVTKCLSSNKYPQTACSLHTGYNQPLLASAFSTMYPTFSSGAIVKTLTPVSLVGSMKIEPSDPYISNLRSKPPWAAQLFSD